RYTHAAGTQPIMRMTSIAARLPLHCRFPPHTSLRQLAAAHAAMKFAHLIEINDPLNPLIEPLSRAQLWRGLMLRASEPESFQPQLDRCTLIEQSGLHLVRELQYGDLVLRDTVRFMPQHQVIYDVPAQKGMPASRLTMTIEEPEPDILFVRFEYENDS